MFKVIIPSSKVYIEGCPSYGIEAIDFRRQHGLPDAPSHVAEIPALEWEDEAFVRAAPRERVSLTADLSGHHEAGRQRWWRVYVRGNPHAVNMSLTSSPANGEWPYVQPQVLAAYLKDPSPETGAALLRDIWAGEARSLEACQAEVSGRKEEEVGPPEKKEVSELIEEVRTNVRVLRDSLLLGDGGLRDPARFVEELVLGPLQLLVEAVVRERNARG